MSELIVEQYRNVCVTELWDEVEGLPAYSVHNGRTVSVFTGETAMLDAMRKYYDLVLPLLYGGKK
jgi:hypothetical protein